MQEAEDKRIIPSKSKTALVVGILVLACAIGVLAYLSQPKAQTSVQAPNPDLPKRDKHSIGVYSRNESVEAQTAPVAVFEGETTNDTTDDSAKSSAVEANARQTSKAPPEKKAEKTKSAQRHYKMHRSSEETFFELAPNSGKHAPDNLDRVAN